MKTSGRGKQLAWFSRQKKDLSQILLTSFFSCVVLSFYLKPFIIHVGLRSSALLALLSSNESASDSELCPVSLESSQELSTATDTSSLPGSTAAICSPSSPSYKVRNRSYFM